MSRRSLRGIATKTAAAAALVLVAAGATTGVVAAAENTNENKPETEAPDQAADGLQTAEDAKANAGTVGQSQGEGEQAGGLPEDLPEQAVADDVLEVITTWEGDRGADFGAAVAEAAQSNRPEDAGSQADDAGSQADEVRQDGDHRPSED